ncbi:MAG: hypothetical protein PHG66_00765 [Candidatus Colwellbacteria bacterium]|nr:hypothetical protein [Candidatus Colwellbacteria bacterium]
MEELKSRIVALNLAKNNYAAKKLKGDTTESDNKDLISTLIYVIAECRRVASDIGISDDGKINREEPSIAIFTHLNQNVNDLKKQIVMLTNSSHEELKALMREQNDARHIAEDKEKKEKMKGKSEIGRQSDMRDHLRETLLAREKKGDSSSSGSSQ